MRTRGMVDISYAIRVGRARQNISQKELAKRIGVFPSAVSAWESGQKVPAGDTLIKVALELDIVGDLFPGYRKLEKSNIETRIAKIEAAIEKIAKAVDT